jgi:hypothetical protein
VPKRLVLIVLLLVCKFSCGLLTLVLFAIVFGTIGRCPYSAFAGLFLALGAALYAYLFTADEFELRTHRPVMEFLNSPNSALAYLAQEAKPWQVYHPRAKLYVCLPFKYFRGQILKREDLRLLVVQEAGNYYFRLTDVKEDA